MKFFSKDFILFFRELEKNNNKKWFDENRKRYEKSVKIPFKTFMFEISKALESLYPYGDLSDRISIMRINRDMRFSNDKSPYKSHMAAMVMLHGKKDRTRPGFYVQASHRDLRVYSGSHALEKEQLVQLRWHIKENLDQFNTLVRDPAFVGTFGQILGDRHKRLPPEFKEMAVNQPLIANKEFYWYFKLPSRNLLDDDIIEQLISKYEDSLPLNHFFTNALKTGEPSKNYN